jgi:hypothetical protein
MSKDENDLEQRVPLITALDAIRARPNMYVGNCVSGARLMACVVESLILLDATPLRVACFGSWHFVRSDKDWLMTDSGAIRLDVFQRLISLPHGDGFYQEVTLNALANAVVTSDFTGMNWIKGDAGKWPLPSDVDLSLPLEKGRILAFHYSKSDLSDFAPQS